MGKSFASFKLNGHIWSILLHCSIRRSGQSSSSSVPDRTEPRYLNYFPGLSVDGCPTKLLELIITMMMYDTNQLTAVFASVCGEKMRGSRLIEWRCSFLKTDNNKCHGACSRCANDTTKPSRILTSSFTFSSLSIPQGGSDRDGQPSEARRGL